jgi:glucokinase
MEYSINVVVDIGGNGTRLALVQGNGLFNRRNENPKSMPELIDAIYRLTNYKNPSALAISVPGLIRGKQVLCSANATWLVGDTANVLMRQFGLKNEKIHVVNDGEAHALALLYHPEAKFGAIHFALGTGVAFGVIDKNGKIQRSLSDDNWEIGDFEIETSASNKAVWYALGSSGFNELRQRTDIDGVERFGTRIGMFAVQMALLFRPKTIGLSGGIIREYRSRIESGFWWEYNRRIDKFADLISKPTVIMLNDECAALTGLTTLF